MPPANITQYLASDEKLLWSGTPRQGLVLRGSDAFQIPFSVLWGGFAIFWEWTAITNSGPAFFSLFGIPFVCAGLYLIAGRFFFDAWRRARTEYGITSERIIIATRTFGASVKSLDARTLFGVTCDAKADGSGTITFGPTTFATSMYAGTPWPGVKLPPAFEMIPDASRVYEIVRNMQKGDKALRP